MQINDDIGFSKTFMKYYSQVGFGGMSKNDFEVLIFHLLRNFGSLKDHNNFNTSIILKIPESKVKRLAYEAELKYSIYDKQNVIKKFFLLVKKTKFKEENKKIQFVIEDKFLRSSISSYLKDLGHFADTSFNSEIISIDLDSFITLLENFFTKEESDEIVSKCKHLIKDKKVETVNFKTLMNEFLEGLAKKSGENSADFLFNAISKSNPVTQIIALIKKFL